MTSAATASASPPVGLICGAGDFPCAVAAALTKAGRGVFLIGLRGSAGAGIEAFPHAYVGVAELGRLFELIAARGIREIAVIGAIVRPDISELRPDLGAVKFLPEAVRLLRGGDNSVLSGVTRFLEGRGLTVRGVHDLAPHLLAGEGALTPRAPDAAARADIKAARACLAALAPHDIGQALIIAKGRIVALEAAEGTDAMIQRVADLRTAGRLRLKGRAGILVKAPKQGQDLRVDLPAVGPRTIEAAAKAGLAGIAVAARGVLILDEAKTIRAAADAGLFLFGFSL